MWAEAFRAGESEVHRQERRPQHGMSESRAKGSLFAAGRHRLSLGVERGRGGWKPARGPQGGIGAVLSVIPLSGEAIPPF